MKLVCCLFVSVAMLFVCACSPKPVHVPITERAAQPAVSEAQTQDSQAEQERKAREKKAIEEELLQRDLERQKMLQEQMKKSVAAFTDILFEFNSYTVDPKYQSVITNVATWMSQNQAAKVTVEGHCDERGTIEYNLALGEKRAEAVKNQLVKAGVKDDRIKTVSYGKEVPVDPAHTEEAWAKNRRAHFKVE
ncbi:MAG TPA: peptidoglycan-associated lipoprotein Pal [Syntrophorhabdales bacterium]|nr:peptidoglycan-associated lipoprotein Pal [Syntrophorhabdales bacterium]